MNCSLSYVNTRYGQGKNCEEFQIISILSVVKTFIRSSASERQFQMATSITIAKHPNIAALKQNQQKKSTITENYTTWAIGFYSLSLVFIDKRNEHEIKESLNLYNGIQS